jgi:hypothetical protein
MNAEMNGTGPQCDHAGPHREESLSQMLMQPTPQRAPLHEVQQNGALAASFAACAAGKPGEPSNDAPTRRGHPGQSKELLSCWCCMSFKADVTRANAASSCSAAAL